MSLFPIYHYRLHNDPIQQFFGDQLDFFDPWNDFLEPATERRVLIVPNSFRWVNEPRRTQRKSTEHPQKFRLQMNIAGFNPETVSTKIENGKVVVEGKQEERQDSGDFNVRQFRKSFPLPDNADAEHLTSYVTPNHMLVIEVPIQQSKTEAQPKADTRGLEMFGEHRDTNFDYDSFLSNLDFQPKIVEKENNEKQLELSVEMKKYKPDEIKVSVKNDELIIKGEHRKTDTNHYERSFFFRSTKLPPGTQIEQIKSFLTEDGNLKINAPFLPANATRPALSNEQPSTTTTIVNDAPTKQDS